MGTFIKGFLSTPFSPIPIFQILICSRISISSLFFLKNMSERSRLNLDTEAQNLIPDRSSLSYIRTAKTRIIETEVSSSLPLQVFLFYNSYYSVLMFILLIMTNGYKVNIIRPPTSSRNTGRSTWPSFWYGV